MNPANKRCVSIPAIPALSVFSASDWCDWTRWALSWRPRLSNSSTISRGKRSRSIPNDENARYAKGLLAAWIYVRYDEAVVEFERVIAVNPSNIGAYFNLGDIYFLTGQEEKAVAVLD
jgi:tetratricopeptide (TPR) repeat protein